MCGIFGMVGTDNVVNKTIEGLQKLEYRGYDSSGIAYLSNKNIVTLKSVGHVKELKNKIDKNKLNSSIALSHTRWATHGKANTQNAHPHFSENKRFCIVHNGIIENSESLKNQYLPDTVFNSDTDTEVVAHLLQKLYEKNTIFTLNKVAKLLTGSYAIVVMDNENLNTLYGIKKNSPLLLGSVNGVGIVSSDSIPIAKYTDKQIVLDDNEIFKVDKQKITVYDNKLKPVVKKHHVFKSSETFAELNGFDYFMHKEIYEVPTAINSTIEKYKKLSDVFKIIPKSEIENIERIVVVACGTAYHAGLIFKHEFERLTSKIANVEIASEFRYSNPKLNSKTLCIFVTQSGETAETISCVEMVKSMGVKTLAVVNVKNSTITHKADYVFYTHAGREIGVASTKAYNAQVALLYLFATAFASVEHKAGVQKMLYQNAYDGIVDVASAKSMVKNIDLQVEKFYKKYKNQKSFYLIGRQQDYLTARESALKLKEITYINCEAYPSGELKHGTISLIEDDTAVIVFATQKNIIDKTINAIHEVRARGAKVILVTSEDKSIFNGLYDDIVHIGEFASDGYLPLVTVVAIQLFAFKLSRELGINPDKPRNLAKSVTVE